MSFRTKLLARVDKIRQIPQRSYDLRQITVDVVVRSWSGISVGVGTHVDSYTRLYVGGAYNVRVQEVTSKDVVASGGLLTMQDLKVGPFTPDYSGGGIPREVYDPPTSTQPQEILYMVRGHGIGSAGTLYGRYDDMSLKNFSAWLYLRSLGAKP